MLAYVFSHRPAPGADVADYEDVLREFHGRLAASHLRGFRASRTYRIGDGYSDWYLLDDSAAMDGLNEAAVTGARMSAHHAAARMAVDGVGKLLSLVMGTHDLEATFESRFGKPTATPYADLYSGLQPVTKKMGTGLWRRMMVLGPPPEFCITSSAPVDLPDGIRAEVVSRTPI